MGLIKIFKRPLPSINNGSTQLYDLLFCDDIELYKKQINQPAIYPWGILFSEACTNEDLQRLISDPQTESRVKILAYRKLASTTEKPQKKKLLAVIVEVGLEKGVDVLASYRDGTARYINQSGKIIVWDSGDDRSDFLINELFYESENILKEIGPWDQQVRIAPPGKGLARITFLLSDGLYFGQAPMNDLFHDSLSGPALNAATLLMQHLTERALQRNQ